jgi:hypothetical protein
MTVHSLSYSAATDVTTVWLVVRKRLHMKPYGPQVLQAVTVTKKLDQLLVDFLSMIQDDENLLSEVILSNKATFHVFFKANMHNYCVWSL